MKTELPELWTQAEQFRPDVILCPRPFPGMCICTKLRIPYVQISYQLMAPTKEYPPMFVNDGMPLKWFPSWHKWLGQNIWPLALKKTADSIELENFETDVLQLP